MESSKDCVLVHSEGCSSFQQRVLRSSLDQVISDIGDLCDPVVEVIYTHLISTAAIIIKGGRSHFGKSSKRYEKMLGKTRHYQMRIFPLMYLTVHYSIILPDQA